MIMYCLKTSAYPEKENRGKETGPGKNPFRQEEKRQQTVCETEKTRKCTALSDPLWNQQKI